MASSISRARKLAMDKYLIISIFIQEKRQARDISDNFRPDYPTVKSRLREK
jgi:hypothetical protein